MGNRNALSQETLRLLSQCPLCQRANQEVDAQMLGADGDVCVWYVRTKLCGHALLAMVMKNRELVSTVGIVTDLSAEDVLRVMAQRAVSIDDVLRTHESFGDPGYLQHLLSPNS